MPRICTEERKVNFYAPLIDLVQRTDSCSGRLHLQENATNLPTLVWQKSRRGQNRSKLDLRLNNILHLWECNPSRSAHKPLTSFHDLLVNKGKRMAFQNLRFQKKKLIKRAPESSFCSYFLRQRNFIYCHCTHFHRIYYLSRCLFPDRHP